jgi:hypothetical protein
MTGKWIVIISLLVTLVNAPPLTAEQGDPYDKWAFDAEIYLWGASIGGKTGSGRDIEVDFGDIFRRLEMAFMGTVGARKGKWSFMLDTIYLDVKDSKNFNIPVGSFLDITAKGTVELTNWILTPSVGYNLFEKERIHLDALFGARYLFLKAATVLDFGTRLPPIDKRITISESIWDGIIGVKGYVTLSKKWYLPYYADIGTGSSNLTWQVFGGVGYRFKRIDLIVAYRYMAWSFDDSDKFDDLNLHGPFAGVKLRF